MNIYIVLLLGFGCLVLLTAWLPMVLNRAPLSLPIVCVGIGAALGAGSLLPWAVPHPQEHLGLIERFTELVVIISLMGAGLKLDRKIAWRRWILTWRLLGIAMPLTILALAVLGHALLGLGVATALLLAASLAPTDPVLASDIQVGPPNSGEEGETRFALTSEAGLNDALAFPFVHAAIALSLAGAGMGWVGEWVLVDVVWKLAAGLGVGLLTGRVLGFMVFHLPNRANLSRTGDGFVALGITCVAYAVAELAHGYGFLAVFVAALTLRATERDNSFHTKLHDFAEELERLLMMALLVGFGAMLVAGGLLRGAGWREFAFAVVAIVLVRPLCGWIALWGSRTSRGERAVISIYGIRGIGSIYYLAYGMGHGSFESPSMVWATLSLIILLSVLLHGASASPVMRWLERKPRGEAPPA
ncbi:MAG: cation:proton antiporter [Bosea sp. (in: a-proteobacteria)]